MVRHESRTITSLTIKINPTKKTLLLDPRKLKATSPGSHRKSQLGLELRQLDSRSPALNYRGISSLSTQGTTIQITMIKTVLTQDS